MKVQATPIVTSLAGGGTVRDTQATAIELAQDDDDTPRAWLIHDVTLEASPNGGLSTGNEVGRIVTEFGFSTDQDGNPAKVAARKSITHLREDTTLAGTHGSQQEVDSTPLLQGTLWVAPYLVVLAENGGQFESTIDHRAFVQYEVVELEDWRTMLELWNMVDETEDRDREWWNP